MGMKFDEDLKKIEIDIRTFYQDYQEALGEKGTLHLANALNSLIHIGNKHNPNVKVKIT